MSQDIRTDDVRTSARKIEKIIDKLDRNVVHHKSEKRFVRIPDRFEKSRNKSPDHTGKDSAEYYNYYKRPFGDLSAEHVHQNG